jgi:hypothetical protein
VGAAIGGVVGGVGRFMINQDTASQNRITAFEGAQANPRARQASFEAAIQNAGDVLGKVQAATIVADTRGEKIFQSGAFRPEQINQIIEQRLADAVAGKTAGDAAAREKRQAELKAQQENRERQHGLQGGIFRTVEGAERENRAGDSRVLRAELDLRNQISQAREKGADISNLQEEFLVGRLTKSLTLVEERREAEKAAAEQTRRAEEQRAELEAKAEAVADSLLTKDERRIQARQELVALAAAEMLTDEQLARGFEQIEKRFKETNTSGGGTFFGAGGPSLRGGRLTLGQGAVAASFSDSTEKEAQQTRRAMLEEMRGTRRATENILGPGVVLVPGTIT